MMKLPLLETGGLIVTEEFLKVSNPIPQANEPTSYWGEGDEVPVEEVVANLYQFRTQFLGEKPASDGKVARLLHSSLGLKRRDAAVNEFWHYFAVVKCPDYVAWRFWNGGKVNRERYLGRWDGNALGRLWWWAELTYDGNLADPYERTEKAATSQEFMLHTVDNILGGNRCIVRALCENVFNGDNRLSDTIIRRTFVKLNAVLVTVAADALDQDAANFLVSSIIEQVEASLD